MTTPSPTLSKYPQQQQLMEVTQGNLLLMEATFLELVSNIRALTQSNQDLEEALVAEPNDLDFSQALKENKYIILKKRQQLLNLVTDMKRMGANIDIPSDIQQMNLDLKGMAHAVMPEPATDNNNRTESNLVRVEEEGAAGEEEGVYL
mmetsp:Transcript_20148/g.49417  ORF Transcript_20148/g.49417 Transcript_20148/m.49417 type:complete len:148 (-) Transcript_20148:272-715(-)|eukprot:CAMPEP_0113631514 /NCGR_PEP_ID=MMETSP0017_2-20120614/16377_1 /TAXON_ID=2856 /ORGANISM="Cylindrotheca closterium" /LENGTH=147 /DNA_ID=CAMNT_0000542027 /DNA_START=51 /DNA_END=494 /DNA_ORIENTATION=+ /assembly_acc=CAM_ASM_000147